MEACVRKSQVCRIKSNHAGANERKIHSRKRRSHRSCGPAPRAGTARVSPRPRQGTADRCSVHAHESAAPLSHGRSDDDGDRGQRAQLLARRQALSDNLAYAKEHSRFACTYVRVHGTSLRANPTAKKQFYHDPRSPWGGKGRRVESRSCGGEGRERTRCPSPAGLAACRPRSAARLSRTDGRPSQDGAVRVQPAAANDARRRTPEHLLRAWRCRACWNAVVTEAASASRAHAGAVTRGALPLLTGGTLLLLPRPRAAPRVSPALDWPPASPDV